MTTYYMRRSPRVYEQDNFAGRVKMAASYISQGRESTRAFDTCFEMWDGDAVAVALVRRSRKNPNTKLAANIWKYIARDTCERLADENSTTDLNEWAKQLREAASLAKSQSSV
jgi:hypothetical protein